MPPLLLHRLFIPRARTRICGAPENMKKMRKRNKMYAREIYVCAGICTLTVFAAN